ncbi:MAG: hypothetical protein KDK78_02505 [Chlamydiia bacterium]|nr:hypothetical protein [Chlamydiia bacterium]
MSDGETGSVSEGEGAGQGVSKEEAKASQQAWRALTKEYSSGESLMIKLCMTPGKAAEFTKHLTNMADGINQGFIKPSQNDAFLLEGMRTYIEGATFADADVGIHDFYPEVSKDEAEALTQAVAKEGKLSLALMAHLRLPKS